MESQRHTDYLAQQMNALKALCPYLEDSAAASSPRAPSATRALSEDKAAAPSTGEGHSLNGLLSQYYESYVSSPLAPVLNATKMAKGLERKRRPGRPPSSKINDQPSCEPPDHFARPGKASVSVWDSATGGYRGTAQVGM
jgi:hypothetical protein